MNYDISSDKFTHPLLKPILGELTSFFKYTEISFFVIGATARDIIMELNNVTSGRLTHDLDIAIAVNNWDKWQEVENEIIKLPNFSKDKTQKQRFLYKDQFHLDIVPFGEIMNQDQKIFWPPNEEIALSVLGFSAAEESALKVKIDATIEIKTATLLGIFVLKIVAWKDRNLESNKDADDLGFILENYLSINQERASTSFYDEIYGVESFTIIVGGATLIGKDIKELLVNHPETNKGILKILSAEIELEEESKLINQIIETHKTFSYEEVLQSIKNIVDQLK